MNSAPFSVDDGVYMQSECQAQGMTQWDKQCSLDLSTLCLLAATQSSRLLAGFIKGAGGISPVDCPGVENVNLSNLISGHFDYAVKMTEIVELLDL